MKKSRFSDSQILAVLKQAEPGVPVPELGAWRIAQHANHARCGRMISETVD